MEAGRSRWKVGRSSKEQVGAVRAAHRRCRHGAVRRQLRQLPDVDLSAAVGEEQAGLARDIDEPEERVGEELERRGALEPLQREQTLRK